MFGCASTLLHAAAVALVFLTLNILQVQFSAIQGELAAIAAPRGGLPDPGELIGPANHLGN